MPPIAPKTWIFDLDGTLVDSFSHYFVTLSAIFEKHGRRFTEELKIPALTLPLSELFEQHLGKNAVQPSFATLHSDSLRDAKLIRPFDGIICRPDSVVVVGDHEHDMLGAKSVGALAVRASWHSYWQADPCTEADFQFRSVPEFRNWISAEKAK
jgi:phosphoglycolate phosphatase-like HAD superfamily hydrolase